jgi:hypothetical protein
VLTSLSKRSNVPGLRSGFVAGDAAILKDYDAAKGIKAFRDGLKGEDAVDDKPLSTPLPRTDSEKDKIVS